MRFEGFSACCSAYIRLDLNDDALDVEERRKGTTNVDFGAKLRGALASIDKETEMEIAIGADAVEITKDGASIVEKKVPLPLRWIKGFAEVQVVIAGMEPAFSLQKIGAQRFLRSLPRGKNDQQIWISIIGSAARVAARESKGSVPIRGCHRLRVLEPLAVLADSLEVHVNRATGATSWAMNFGTQTLWLVLNAEPWRGFSGDGGVLRGLASADTRGVAEVAAQLNWQDRIDVDSLATTAGLPPETVAIALSKLAAGGQVGFDLARAAYFHRELPFDMSQVEGLNPRLKSAQALFDKGAVNWDGDAAKVMSDGAIHSVTREDTGWQCTCPWFAKNGGQRGPCKHALAAEMELDRKDD